MANILHLNGSPILLGGTIFGVDVVVLSLTEGGDGVLTLTVLPDTAFSVTISGATDTTYNGTYTTDVNGTTLTESALASGPLCLKRPTITGTPVVGNTLSRDSGGLWIGQEGMEITQRWYVGGTAVPYTAFYIPTMDDFKPKYPDVGSTVTLRETATDSNGSTSEDSAATSAVTAPASITKFVIVGASIIEQSCGRYLDRTNSTMTTAIQGAPYNQSGVEIYGYGVSATTLTDGPYLLERARESFPDAAIVLHLGGGDVNSYAPFSTATPSEAAAFQSAFEAIVTKANELAGDIYIGSITFRTNGGATPENPDIGSKPFNETDQPLDGTKPFEGVIPVLIDQQTSGTSITTYNRPYFDFYRKMLENFDTWLEGDGIHPNATGEAGLRDWLVETIDTILDGGEPAEITERTVT